MTVGHAGAWVLDLAHEVPSTVRIDGTDISDVYFPTSPPANAYFSVNTVTRMPLEWTSQFDFVHQRSLFSALRSFEWLAAISEIYRVTKPGGHVQLFEPNPRPPNMPGLAAVQKAWKIMEQLFDRAGLRKYSYELIELLLKEAGFKDVRVYWNDIPVGKKWGDLGEVGVETFLGASKGSAEALLKMGIIASRDEWLRLCDEVEKEVEVIEGLSYSAAVICATKPGN